jgi:hypothetical protein
MKPTNDLQQFSPRHRLLLDDIVLNGLTNSEAAHKHGFRPEYISVIKSTGLWKKEERQLREEILSGHRKRLADLIPSAMDTLKEVMGKGYEVEVGTDDMGEPLTKFISNPPATRANAAQIILDRSGMGAKLEHDSSNSVIINMYKPPWSEGDGDVVTIEVNDGVQERGEGASVYSNCGRRPYKED